MALESEARLQEYIDEITERQKAIVKEVRDILYREIERKNEKLKEIIELNRSFSLMEAFSKSCITVNLAKQALKESE